MQPNLPLMDRAIFASVEKAEQAIEKKLQCDVIYYCGELRVESCTVLRDTIECLVSVNQAQRKKVLSICLTTGGGQAEVVENMVEIVRHHYDTIYFIVPRFAMSAGTIFCMSGDKIYMDYSSSLGPIDPQVLDSEGKVLVPALGYLDKVEEFIKKSSQGSITNAELAQLDKLDLARLRFYEQAQDLSEALLKKWLVRYKFAGWTKHRTTKPGTSVTPKEKEQRASTIASDLSDNKRWHSHGRRIGIKTLREELKLEIDDFGKDQDLQGYIRGYSETLTDYYSNRLQTPPFVIYNRKVH